MLYMWMKYCKMYTFERRNDTTNAALGVVANLG